VSDALKLLTWDEFIKRGIERSKSRIAKLEKQLEEERQVLSGLESPAPKFDIPDVVKV
jgi:hypothetical protein